MTASETYIDLLTDPAHWLFELTLIAIFDVLIGIILWPLIKRSVRRHDDAHHGPDKRPDESFYNDLGFHAPKDTS